ncbi:hypothetical protein, partial [Salmonella enterica]
MQDLPSRRAFLRHSTRLALGLGAIAQLPLARAQTEPYAHSAGTQRAASRLPADACDCHMHIYDPR